MVLRWECCAYRIMRCNDCARHSDPLVGLQVCWKACSAASACYLVGVLLLTAL